MKNNHHIVALILAFSPLTLRNALGWDPRTNSFLWRSDRRSFENTKFAASGDHLHVGVARDFESKTILNLDIERY